MENLISLAANAGFVAMGWALCRWQWRVRVNFAKLTMRRLEEHFQPGIDIIRKKRTYWTEHSGRHFWIVSTIADDGHLD